VDRWNERLFVGLVLAVSEDDNATAQLIAELGATLGVQRVVYGLARPQAPRSPVLHPRGTPEAQIAALRKHAHISKVWNRVQRLADIVARGLLTAEDFGPEGEPATDAPMRVGVGIFRLAALPCLPSSELVEVSDG
jgi:hypothetical protein